jgi:hypothetical protein
MTTITATTAETLSTPAMAARLGISAAALRRQRHKFTEGQHYRVRRGLSPHGEILWDPTATEARAEQLRSGTATTATPMPVEVHQ